MPQLFRRSTSKSDRNNNIARQRFLDALSLEDAAPYAKKVVYAESSRKKGFRDGMRMATVPSWWTLLGLRGGRSTIKVFEAAFDKYKILDDFLSVLVDHEGFHARDYYERPGILPRTVEFRIGLLEFITFGITENPFKILVGLKVEAEIRAREHQLRMIESGKRNCSQEFIDGLKEDTETLRRLKTAPK